MLLNCYVILANFSNIYKIYVHTRSAIISWKIVIASNSRESVLRNGAHYSAVDAPMTIIRPVFPVNVGFCLTQRVTISNQTACLRNVCRLIAYSDNACKICSSVSGVTAPRLHVAFIHDSIICISFRASNGPRECRNAVWLV